MQRRPGTSQPLTPRRCGIVSANRAPTQAYHRSAAPTDPVVEPAVKGLRVPVRALFHDAVNLEAVQHLLSAA